MVRGNYRFAIGIDCGVKTGIAVYDRLNKRLVEVSTQKIHEAMDLVRMYAAAHPNMVIVRVEDARLRKWIPRQANEKAERGRREGAGSVKRDAKIWEDFLSDLTVKFEMVAPANNVTKLSSESFALYTRYRGATSEHARDAGMLVFNY